MGVCQLIVCLGLKPFSKHRHLLACTSDAQYQSRGRQASKRKSWPKLEVTTKHRPRAIKRADQMKLQLPLPASFRPNPQAIRLHRCQRVKQRRPRAIKRADQMKLQLPLPVSFRLNPQATRLHWCQRIKPTGSCQPMRLPRTTPQATQLHPYPRIKPTGCCQPMHLHRTALQVYKRTRELLGGNNSDEALIRKLALREWSHLILVSPQCRASDIGAGALVGP